MLLTVMMTMHYSYLFAWPQKAEDQHCKQSLRDALTRAIPNVSCRRRGSNKVIMEKSPQKCDVWLLQQRQDLGRSRIVQGATESQGLMLFEAGYDASMLERVENELRHQLLHTPNNQLRDLLADYFPEPFQGMLQNRITWTGFLKPKIFLQEMDLRPALQLSSDVSERGWQEHMAQRSHA